ncbi:MAG: Uma2 family endonuclease, partial [Acidobacteria bacterium]|nr:Uma2 family endonuclease [Acidobacteriota bacterium]
AMRALKTELMDAVDHLPSASVLVLDDVSWEEYEEILVHLESRPSIRTTYDQGRLEIVTTSPVHEKWKEFILGLVRVVCQELNIAAESYGGFTQKKRKDEKGTEADTCFYIANAERMIGKDEIDINVDPPPDIVVEVDKANQSLRKFPIYATFGVPEIWRCDVRHKQIEIYELRDKKYVENPSSRFFPILTGAVLVDFIEQSRTIGQTAALAVFQEWIRSAPKP